MKPSEFYEKYWKIVDRNGNLVSPPALTNEEKEFLDKCVSEGASFVYISRKRRRSTVINIDFLLKEYKNSPNVLIFK